MPLQFIDNNAPVSEAARRRIRSHAATGRNLGKKLVRGLKNKGFKSTDNRAVNSIDKLTSSSIRLQGGGVVYHDVPSQDVEALQIERQVGDGLMLLGLPVPVAAGDKVMTQRVMALITAPRHPPDLEKVVIDCGGPAIFAELYFKDPTFFHGMMALSILALSRLCNAGEHPQRAMSHHVHTLRLLNKKLSSVDPASIANIAVIVVMLQYERHIGRYEQGLVHMNGLLRMIELRGGIGKMVEVEPSITIKIFRNDLDYSLCLGTRTVFRVDDVVPLSQSLFGLDGAERNMQLLEIQRMYGRKWQTGLNNELRAVFLDAAGLAHMINQAAAGRGRRLFNWELHHTVILLGYQLINECPLTEAGDKYPPLGRAVHFGLAAYFMTFLSGFDHRVAASETHVRLARSIIKEGLLQTTLRTTAEIKIMLWVICVASVLTPNDSDLAWLLPALSQVLQSLGICSWDDASDVLSQFPWVNIMHDKYGRRLWDALSHTSDQHLTTAGSMVAIKSVQ